MKFSFPFINYFWIALKESSCQFVNSTFSIFRCNNLEDIWGATTWRMSQLWMEFPAPLSALLFQNANDPDEQMLKSCTKKLLLLTCQMVWLKADAVSNMLFSGFKSCNCEVTACIWRTLKLNQSISKCNEIYSPSTELDFFFFAKMWSTDQS